MMHELYLQSKNIYVLNGVLLRRKMLALVWQRPHCVPLNQWKKVIVRCCFSGTVDSEIKRLCGLTRRRGERWNLIRNNK